MAREILAEAGVTKTGGPFGGGESADGDAAGKRKQGEGQEQDGGDEGRLHLNSFVASAKTSRYKIL